MSQVRRGTTTFDDTPFELVAYPSGASLFISVEAGALGAQDLTLSAYTRVHQAAEEILARSAVISGPTPSDPSILEMAIVSTQPIRIDGVLSTSTGALCPWWIESRGRVSTIENGENTTTADGSQQTVAASLFPGVFLWLVDVSAMQAGDKVKLRLKSRRSGSDYVAQYVLLEDAQDNGIYQFGPIVVPEYVTASLEQSAGGYRDFPSSLVRLG